MAQSNLHSSVLLVAPAESEHPHIEQLESTLSAVERVDSPLAAIKRLAETSPACIVIARPFSSISIPQFHTQVAEMESDAPIVLTDPVDPTTIEVSDRAVPLSYAPANALVSTVEAICQRQRMQNALDDQRALKERVGEIARELLTTSDRETVLRVLYDHLRDRPQYRLVWLLTYDEHDETVSLQQPVTGVIDPATLSTGETDGNPIARAVETGAVVVDEGAARTRSASSTDLPAQTDHSQRAGRVSTVVVPVDDTERGHVCVFLQSEPGARIDEAEQTLLAAIGELGRTALGRLDSGGLDPDAIGSILAHDLRNPLNVAHGQLDMAAAADDPDQHLDAAANALDRMAALIEDVQTLTRESDPVDEADLETVDLASIAEQCWRTVETADASLTVDTDSEIRAAPSRLRQLLENLFRNAVEHAGPDVTVTVSDIDGGFYVADDGPGIPDHERADVFEPGFSTAEQGTGLGLAIVKQIADAHGWDISVTESAQGGARFEITGLEITS